MSATMQFPVTDAFLLKYGAQMPPGNKLEVDPEYGNIELTTPYCRLSFVYFDPPKMGRMINGQMSKTSAQALLMFNPAGTVEIYNALLAIADNNFNPEQRPGPDGNLVTWKPSDLLYAPAGMNGIINPLKEGTEQWRNSAKPQLYEVQRGLFTLNATMPVTNGQGNPQSPIYLDEQAQPCSPRNFYAGCYARAIVRLSPYPRRGQQGFGKRGISAYLHLVQFVAHGERLGSFNALANGQERIGRAGAVPVDPAFTAPIPPQGHPAGAMPGFAAPPPLPPQPPAYQPSIQSAQAYQPQQQAQQPVYQPAPSQGLPPQQPQPAYAPAGARPPG